MKPQNTKEAFLEFCERKPADEVFDVSDPEMCAVGQFAKSLGFVRSSANFALVTDTGKLLPIQGLDRGLMYDGISFRSTFGKLAARLRGA